MGNSCRRLLLSLPDPVAPRFPVPARGPKLLQRPTRGGATIAEFRQALRSLASPCRPSFTVCRGYGRGPKRSCRSGCASALSMITASSRFTSRSPPALPRPVISLADRFLRLRASSTPDDAEPRARPMKTLARAVLRPLRVRRGGPLPPAPATLVILVSSAVVAPRLFGLQFSLGFSATGSSFEGGVDLPRGLRLRMAQAARRHVQ
jgi:hypothetical protein